ISAFRIVFHSLHATSSNHTHLVAKFFDQFLGHLSRWAFQHFSFLALLWNIELFNLLQVGSERSLYFVQADLAQRLVLGLLDSEQRGVAQLVDPGLIVSTAGKGMVTCWKNPASSSRFTRIPASLF